MIFIIIVFVSLFTLFNNNFVENLENICTKCFVNPRDNNCIRIKEIKMEDTNDIYNLNVKIEDTSYVFCPWINNCKNSNILSQTERANLKNEEIRSDKAFNTQHNCCNNSGTNSNFYSNNVSSYSNNTYVVNNKTKCNKINNLISQNRDIFDEDVIGDDYFKLRTLCNFNTEISGSLFFIEEDNKYTNILENKDLNVDDILKMQNRLEIRYNTNNESEKANIRDKIRNLNNELKSLNLNSMRDMDRKIAIQNELASYYSTIKNTQYIYKLVDNSYNIQNSYTIYDDEAYNCFGNKQNLNKDISKNQFDTFFANNTRFGVSSDAQYKTQQDLLETNYPSQRDLELEMKNLPSLNQTGTAPVSVINLYMSAINRFYEKQLDNMLGPRTHTIQKTIDFTNDGLSINDKFFTYNSYDTSNNTYPCEASILGNNEFKYCGPAAFYSGLKF